MPHRPRARLRPARVAGLLACFLVLALAAGLAGSASARPAAAPGGAVAASSGAASHQGQLHRARRALRRGALVEVLRGLERATTVVPAALHPVRVRRALRLHAAVRRRIVRRGDAAGLRRLSRLQRTLAELVLQDAPPTHRSAVSVGELLRHRDALTAGGVRMGDPQLLRALALDALRLADAAERSPLGGLPLGPDGPSIADAALASAADAAAVAS